MRDVIVAVQSICSELPVRPKASSFIVLLSSLLSDTIPPLNPPLPPVSSPTSPTLADSEHGVGKMTSCKHST